MKQNIFKYSFLLGVITLLTTFTKITIAESIPVKIVAEIIDGNSELLQKIDENIYESIVENNYEHEIVFISNSDVKSFPKKVVLKPREKQLFKFIANNKSSISLTYKLNNKLIDVQTYNDLYFSN